MSDSEELDLGEGDSPEETTSAKKKGGLGALLPTILKIAAIGIAAVIFIVTVVVITTRVMRDGGRAASPPDITSPYVGRRPTFQFFEGIGEVQTSTRDGNHQVRVVMNIGFDLNDTVTASELSMRRLELRDFTRRHFAAKFADDLRPENEERIRREIIEILNTRFLDTGRVRLILFDRLDVMAIDLF